MWSKQLQLHSSPIRASACRYLEEPEIYPFSHGLSYTKFEYRGLELLAGPNNSEDANSFVVKMEVHNTGQASHGPPHHPPPLTIPPPPPRLIHT